MNIYLDTETDLIQPGVLAPELTCVQFAQNNRDIYVAVAGISPVEDKDLEELLYDILENFTIVGHNIAYDMLVILRQFPALTELVFQAYEDDRVSCTIVREKLKNIRQGRKGRKYSLEDLAKKYGETKDGSDPWRSRYGELRGVPFDQWPESAREYAVHDITALRAVYVGQGPTEADEARQTRAAFVMHCIGANGINTDPKAVEEFEASIDQQHMQDMKHLVYKGLVRGDGTRVTKLAKKHIKDAFVFQGIEPRLTKKGEISLDEEACRIAGDETLDIYQRYGSHKNLLSRIQGLKKGYNTPLNPRFDSLLETGRTSCSKGSDDSPANGYQTQNMRRAVGERECFIPREGNVILASDFDIFELANLAQVCLWVCGRSKLAEAINGGLDPHLAMAAQVLGWDYDYALKVLKDENHPEHEIISEARQGCKIANFGYPGGMGARSFVGYARGYGMDITLDKSKELKTDWLRTWPEMTKYFAWVNGHKWHEGIISGYRMKFTNIKQFGSDRIRGRVTYTVACNSFFQGLAADAAKAAGWALNRECMIGRLRGWEIWNFVHDEYLLQGPKEDGDRAAKIVREVMIAEATEWILDVKIEATPVLMNRWSKKAKPSYDDEGKLIPWKP